MAIRTYNSDGSVRSTTSKTNPTSTTVTYKKADGSLGTYQESSAPVTRSARQQGAGGLPSDSMNTALDIQGGDTKDTSLAPIGTSLTPTSLVDPEKPITAQQKTIEASTQQGVFGALATPKPSTLPGASTDLSSQYNSAASMLNQSGATAAQGTGAGMAAVSQAMSTVGQPPEPPSILGGVMETDNAFDNIFKMFDDFMSPVKQKTSLVQEYQKMSKALGINEINAELVDAKKIIEGTEDDIRAEVTATGGFATDSQVLALAGARNKSLIKNYNALLETRDNAMQQLNTMMNLTMEDRKSAEAELDRKMNFGFQVAQFQQRAQENARQTYMTLGSQMGWDTLLNSVSPYERGILQRTLGVSDAALTNLATASQKARIFAEQKQGLEIESLKSGLLTDEMNRKNITSLIADRNARLALDKEKKIQDTKLQASLNRSVTKADTILSNVKKATSNVGIASTGFGSFLKKVPGTKAYNLEKTLTTIKANIGFEELQAMRAASPTGGALGQVAVQELEALQAVIGSLDTGQTPTQLKENLNAVETHYVNWLGTVGFEYDPNTGDIIQINQ